MNLYLLERIGEVGWGEYVSAVVAAETEADALTIHPCREDGDPYSTWAKPENLRAKLIGLAVWGTERGPIHTDFKGG
jgi:hypothetical protein